MHILRSLLLLGPGLAFHSASFPCTSLPHAALKCKDPRSQVREMRVITKSSSRGDPDSEKANCEEPDFSELISEDEVFERLMPAVEADKSASRAAKEKSENWSLNAAILAVSLLSTGIVPGIPAGSPLVTALYLGVALAYELDRRRA